MQVRRLPAICASTDIMDGHDSGILKGIEVCEGKAVKL